MAAQCSNVSLLAKGTCCMGSSDIASGVTYEHSCHVPLMTCKSQVPLDSGEGIGTPSLNERSAKATLWNGCGMGNIVVSTFGKYNLTQILKNKYSNHVPYTW